MSEYLDIPSLYGSSVFSDKEMRARLPREIYKRLAASMATGEELDPAVADATASVSLFAQNNSHQSFGSSAATRVAPRNEPPSKP